MYVNLFQKLLTVNMDNALIKLFDKDFQKILCIIKFKVLSFKLTIVF
jgi:hypothetical protein